MPTKDGSKYYGVWSSHNVGDLFKEVTNTKLDTKVNVPLEWKQKYSKMQILKAYNTKKKFIIP